MRHLPDHLFLIPSPNHLKRRQEWFCPIERILQTRWRVLVEIKSQRVISTDSFNGIYLLIKRNEIAIFPEAYSHRGIYCLEMTCVHTRMENI